MGSPTMLSTLVVPPARRRADRRRDAADRHLPGRPPHHGRPGRRQRRRRHPRPGRHRQDVRGRGHPGGPGPPRRTGGVLSVLHRPADHAPGRRPPAGRVHRHRGSQAPQPVPARRPAAVEGPGRRVVRPIPAGRTSDLARDVITATGRSPATLLSGSHVGSDTGRCRGAGGTVEPAASPPAEIIQEASTTTSCRRTPRRRRRGRGYPRGRRPGRKRAERRNSCPCHRPGRTTPRRLRRLPGDRASGPPR